MEALHCGRIGWWKPWIVEAVDREKPWTVQVLDCGTFGQWKLEALSNGSPALCKNWAVETLDRGSCGPRKALDCTRFGLCNLWTVEACMPEVLDRGGLGLSGLWKF